jgi:glycosyltransferase involved in cell wall biosynthesis
MLAAAELLRDDPTIHFLFIGSGAKQAWMEEQVSEKRLTNVALVGQRPRSDQTNFLNACDVALISLVPGMTGVSVPSRLYNIMAAGKPVIAFAEADSEVCRVVLEEGIGWVVDPKAPKELAKVIEEARRKPERLAGMGKRAREVAESKYSEAVAVRHFESVLEELD